MAMPTLLGMPGRQADVVLGGADAGAHRGADGDADVHDDAGRLTASPFAAWLAEVAVQSLMDEAELTPKPALVDQRGSGAHVDLTLSLMRKSARSLKPGFMAMAHATTQGLPDLALRERLGAIGRDAEQAMLQATRGSNAHRGAIWVIGLLVASAAIEGEGARRMTGSPDAHPHPHTHPRQPQYRADLPSLAAIGARLAQVRDRHAPTVASHGLRVRARYGAQGARGEAVAGFPHVFSVGLPALHVARARGECEPHARLNALVAIMAQLEDTCLLHRGGTEALLTAQQGAKRVLTLGGVGTAAGWNALLRLDEDLLMRNASPGGAADLLAATLFVDRIGSRLADRFSPSHQE